MLSGKVDPDSEEAIEGLIDKFYEKYKFKGADHNELEKTLRNIAVRIQDAAVTGELYTREAYIRRLKRDTNDDGTFDHLRKVSGFDSQDGKHNPEVLLEVGNALHKRGEYEESIKFFNLLLRKNPDYVWVHLEKAKSLHASGKTNEAIICCQEEMRVNPDHFWMYHDIGFYLIEKEEFKEAKEALDKAVELDPSNPCGHHMTGVLYYRQGLFEQAKPHFKKAIELRPDDEWFHNDLGHCYRNQGKFEEALEEYLDALRLDKKDVERFRADVGNCWITIHKRKKEIGFPTAPLGIFDQYQKKADELIKKELAEKGINTEDIGSYLESIADTEAGQKIDRALSIADLFADDESIEISDEYDIYHNAGDVNLRLAWLHRRRKSKNAIFSERAIQFYHKALKKIEEKKPDFPTPISTGEVWTYRNLAAAYREIGDEENGKKYADRAP